MIRLTAIVVLMLTFLAIAIPSVWGKPYTIGIVTYVPWWAYLLVVGVIVLMPWRKR